MVFALAHYISDLVITLVLPGEHSCAKMYCIAEIFHKSEKNTIHVEKTSTDCLLLQWQRMPHSPHFAEKTFMNSHKTAKFVKFSPLEDSCYTVYVYTVIIRIER